MGWQRSSALEAEILVLRQQIIVLPVTSETCAMPANNGIRPHPILRLTPTGWN
jgi:hypothetical protein